MKNYMRELIQPKFIIIILAMVISPMLFALGVTYSWFSDKAISPIAEVDNNSQLKFAIPFGGVSLNGATGAAENSLAIEVDVKEETRAWYPGEITESLVTVNNPNNLPIVFRIARNDNADGMLEDFLEVEQENEQENDTDEINRLFGIGQLNGNVYFGQLEAGASLNLKVKLKVKIQDLSLESINSPNIPIGTIRVDACESTIDSVKDYFNLQVQQDPKGVISIKS